MFAEGRLIDYLIVGIVALIVVGPKDLPILMRKVGQALARMRALAAEFRASFDEMARQSELDELRREVEALRSGQTLKAAVGLGPDVGIQGVFDDVHAGLRDSVADMQAAVTSPPATSTSPITPAIVDEEEHSHPVAPESDALPPRPTPAA